MREAFLTTLSVTPLRIGALLEGLYSAEAGGVATFIGVTRARRAAGDARTTVALEYQAYEPMALRELERLLEEARHRWPLTAAVAVHRTGIVPAGEPSVVVGAATLHRAEAFEACRWLIDTLKHRVPIWKCERYADGSHEWAAGAWAPAPTLPELPPL
jgi:molybdopterin synthase catalytic subunit